MKGAVGLLLAAFVAIIGCVIMSVYMATLYSDTVSTVDELSAKVQQLSDRIIAYDSTVFQLKEQVGALRFELTDAKE